MTPRSVRPGAERDAIDGIVPNLVVAGRNTDEVAQIVTWASAEKRALVAVGGGTRQGIGNPPRAFDVRLELSHSEASIDPSPNDMVVTLGAGISLARANERLKASGQRLGLTALDAHRSTLGGIASTDCGGALAYSFGGPRDQILGMTVVDGNGRRLRAGGRVVKNVAGYDLPRLFAGSYGTLGIITELTLRTHPLPMCSNVVRLEVPDANALESSRAALFASNLPLRSLDFGFARNAGRWRRSLQMVIEGTHDEIVYQTDRIAALCSGAWPCTSESPSARASAESEATFRFACRPSRAVALVEALLEGALAERVDCSAMGECGGATIRWTVSCSEIGEFRSALDLASKAGSSLSATFVVESAPAPAKRTLDVWGAAPAGLEIMKRLKARFDPLGIFAPGRFVGGI